MVGIRTITYDITDTHEEKEFDIIRKASILWASTLDNIHTQRIVACPVRNSIPADLIETLNKFCDTSDIRWYDIPIDPWGSDNTDDLFQHVTEIIYNNPRCFLNVLAVKDGKLDDGIVNKCISLIRAVSSLSYSGKDNFRVGCSVNIKPNGAFFPFTYSGGEIGFSIGLELIEDINEICQRNRDVSLVKLRNLIIDHLYPQVEQINVAAVHIADITGMRYYGIDFSIAPMISRQGSVLNLLTRLGIYNFGGTGTLFGTSYFTDIVKELANHFPAVGFSGVMYSVLEDLGICMINNQKGINLDDLIKCSTMCGCGIDMVPVPSDITDGEMICMFRDVFAISSKLHKPLGIRILPIPMASRGVVRYTGFSDDADFIANTRVMNLDGNTSYMNNDTFFYES